MSNNNKTTTIMFTDPYDGQPIAFLGVVKWDADEGGLTFTDRDGDQHVLGNQSPYRVHIYPSKPEEPCAVDSTIATDIAQKLSRNKASLNTIEQRELKNEILAERRISDGCRLDASRMGEEAARLREDLVKIADDERDPEDEPGDGSPLHAAWEWKQIAKNALAGRHVVNDPCNALESSNTGQMATAQDKMFWMLQETTAKMAIDEIYQLRARCEEHFNKLTSPTEWAAYQRNVATVKRNRQ